MDMQELEAELTRLNKLRDAASPAEARKIRDKMLAVHKKISALINDERGVANPAGTSVQVQGSNAQADAKGGTR